MNPPLLRRSINDDYRTLRARSSIFHIHLNLFLVIISLSSSQFYNIVDVNYIFSKLLHLFLISNEKGNTIVDFI